MFVHTYWDHGTKTGETYSFDEAVAFLVEEGAENGSPWTEEDAKAALSEAQENGESVCVDYDGDHFEELVPCSD